MRRNEMRVGKERIPAVAIHATYKKLEKPTRQEGFDELYSVRIGKPEDFIIEELGNS
jgi:hypothetical protein